MPQQSVLDDEFLSASNRVRCHSTQHPRSVVRGDRLPDEATAIKLRELAYPALFAVAA
jgi:hypothetical protein